jgi:MFS family permease
LQVAAVGAAAVGALSHLIIWLLGWRLLVLVLVLLLVLLLLLLVVLLLQGPLELRHWRAEER